MDRPPGTSTPVIFHAGEVHEAKGLLVSPVDQALVQGQAVFETLIAYRGKPFALGRHLDRLGKSAEAMDLKMPESGTVDSAIATVLEAGGFDNADRARIRITLTGGVGDPRFTDTPALEQLFVEASLAPVFAKSASVVTVPFARNDRSALAGLKTINYGENIVAFRLAREAGADEAVFRNTRDQLCEGTWSNIFVHAGGRWLTPPLSSGCLPGVTRAIVLELAEAAGIRIDEIDFPMSELESADAAFLTSTLRELQSVRAIDGRELPLANPPGWTELLAAYRARVESES